MSDSADRNVFLNFDLSEPPHTSVQVGSETTGGQECPNDLAEIDGKSDPLVGIEPTQTAGATKVTAGQTETGSDNMPVRGGKGRDRMESMLATMLQIQKQQMDSINRLLLPGSRKRKQPDSAGLDQVRPGLSGASAGKRKQPDSGSDKVRQGLSGASTSQVDQPRSAPLKRNSSPRSQIEADKPAGGAHDMSDVSDSEDEFDKILIDSDEEEIPEEDLGAEALLEEFQGSFGDADKTSAPVSDKHATTVNGALRGKINNEARSRLLDKYDRPENVPNLTVPTVNREMWNVVKNKPMIKSRELNLARMQRTVNKAMIPLLQLTDGLMTARAKKSPVDQQSLLQLSTDALRLLASVHGDFNTARRQNIKPVMKDTFKSLCGSQNEVTMQLFGDDVSKKMKDLREAKNVTASWKEDHQPGHTRRFQGQGTLYNRHRYQPYNSNTGPQNQRGKQWGSKKGDRKYQKK